MERSYGHSVVSKLLLEIKADLEANVRDCQTPLSYATENGHEAVLNVLQPFTSS
jgi:ankyrin repeat protein